MKTWAELSTAERMSPRKRWDALAEEGDFSYSLAQ